jgi:hypothetical protein
VRGGHDHLGAALIRQPLDRVDDRLRPVGVDKLDERAEILPRRIVLDVVLHLAPVREQEQFRVIGAPACLQVLCRPGDQCELLPAGKHVTGCHLLLSRLL